MEIVPGIVWSLLLLSWLKIILLCCTACVMNMLSYSPFILFFTIEEFIKNMDNKNKKKKTAEKLLAQKSTLYNLQLKSRLQTESTIFNHMHNALIFVLSRSLCLSVYRINWGGLSVGLSQIWVIKDCSLCSFFPTCMQGQLHLLIRITLTQGCTFSGHKHHSLPFHSGACQFLPSYGVPLCFWMT